MNKLWLLFLGLGLSTSAVSYAQVESFPTTRMSFTYPQYSGENAKSFSETGTGLGAEIQISRPGIWISPFLRGRFVVVTGEQAFVDGTSNTTASFNYYQGSLDIGTNLYPIRRRKKGINLYIGLGGVFSYQTIRLADEATITNIPRSDQSVGYGYQGSIGSELILSNSPNYKWTLVAELNYRQESANILKQSQFDLKNVSFTAGIGW
jgi:hypothetical protein